MGRPDRQMERALLVRIGSYTGRFQGLLRLCRRQIRCCGLDELERRAQQWHRRQGSRHPSTRSYRAGFLRVIARFPMDPSHSAPSCWGHGPHEVLRR